MSPNIFSLIPARSGSKGIKDKNIKELAGISLLERAVKFSKNIPFSSFSLVSTDSEEYSKIAINAGSLFLGSRPLHLSNDLSSSEEVLKYEWLRLEQYLSKRFEFAILLEPTSPFRKLVDIEALYNEVVCKANFKSAFTASQLPSSLAPSKIFTLSEKGYITQYGSDSPSTPLSNKVNCPANLLIKNGAGYLVSRDQLFIEGRIVTPYSYVHIIDGLRLNIDTINDLYLAYHYQNLLSS